MTTTRRICILLHLQMLTNHVKEVYSQHVSDIMRDFVYWMADTPFLTAMCRAIHVLLYVAAAYSVAHLIFGLVALLIRRML